MTVTGLQPGDARGIYKNTQLDLRVYRRIQMWNHAEALIDDKTNLRNGDLALFVRLGSDVKSNYYEYESPLDITPAGNYNNLSSADRQIVWPIHNFLDVALDEFTNLKAERNREKSAGTEGVGYARVFSRRDPGNENNTISILGNPSLSDVRVMLIGIRNKSNSVKDGCVWVNEMKVTDFNESGGWAAKANVNLALSDIATVNFSGHIESAGFGGVDQSLAARSKDEYRQFNIAVQGDAGRLVPEKLKLSAPVYYSKSNETITPKYNPLDQDMLLKDALDAATTKHEKDSIRNYAVTHKTVESFSLSNFRFDIRSKTPMPWDPANFQLSFSFNKQKNIDPTTEYENTNDYRGSFQYSYSPMIKDWKPFSKLKGKGKFQKFLKDWGLRWIFNSLTFYTNMSRYYYEQQTRSEVDVDFQLPVQVSKNFLWDRQLNLTWNLTQSLNFTFASNTTARIEEAIGAVNKRLFPDKYRDWKDTVLNSIKHFGTPWNYNQTFTASYRAPFSRIPFLDYLSGNVTYNSTYRWDKGATVDELYMGNSIQNQSTWNADARLNFETLFNKSKYLREINRRFSSSNNSRNKNANERKNPKEKKFERAITLSPDTLTQVKHNLKTKKIKLTALADGKPMKLETKIVDENTVDILTRGTQQIKLTIRENPKGEKKNVWKEVSAHAVRFLMMPRNASFRWRSTHSMTLPQFSPNVGNAFGQTRAYGPMAPGLDFAFGFFDESYVNRALDRGWLLTGNDLTSPAIWNKTNEFNFELTLEPIRGLKILLTSNLTDNRTQQVQFMYSDMPTSRTGSYTRTHWAFATALRNSKADNGYASEAFDKFLANIPVATERVEAQYAGTRYPKNGFMEGNALAGMPYSSENAGVSPMSSDVLIPAFISAYSGQDIKSITLRHFPGLGSMRPNWRITYDGFRDMGNMKKWFKTFTLTHAYQCTYSVGSYGSYLNWLGVDGDCGFILDEQTQMPMPSSPFNITSVAITEKFAPLIGVNMTLNNDLSINCEYRDSRTLTLNTSAGQIVEANSRQLTVGAGFKIANFNKVLKMGNRQGGINNDLSLNFDLSWATNQALIRKIESAFTQATSGTQTLSLNFTASYVLSKRITLSAFFDHQVNTPLVSNSSYPTSNSNYGVSCNISLAR